MNNDNFNALDYERRYQEGYGVVYPESHIIRIHRHILDWELNVESGRIFDFGCGLGAHLKYFATHSFIPYGCDTSHTAINYCKSLMPDFESHFFVTPTVPDLLELLGTQKFDIFLSNQVFYFLNDCDIRNIVEQAYSFVRSNGVFIATMMSYSCWYSRYIVGTVGDLKQVEFSTPRCNDSNLINFKYKDELVDLFSPFRKIHLGSYGSHIREEEGSTDHWIFVGLRD